MSKTHKDIKVRKGWGDLKPWERIHGQGKKHGYDRQREKRNWSDNYEH